MYIVIVKGKTLIIFEISLALADRWLYIKTLTRRV